jgi:hypothetical protein
LVIIIYYVIVSKGNEARMKMLKSNDSARVRDAVAQISLEMQGLKEKIEGGIDSSREGTEDILLELRNGTDTMQRILERLDDIAAELEELRRPWYSRLFCRF